VSPVKYELGFHIPEDDILHSHRRVQIKSYIAIQLITIACGQFKVSVNLSGCIV
jgi:hypothetical protein